MDETWKKRTSEVWKYFDRTEKYGVCKQCEQRFLKTKIRGMTRHMTNVHELDSDVMQYFRNVYKNFADCLLCNCRIRKTRKGNLIRHVESEHHIKIKHLPYDILYNSIDSASIDSPSIDSPSIDSTSIDSAEKVDLSELDDSTESDEIFECSIVTDNTKLQKNQIREFPNSFIELFKTSLCGLILEDGVSPSVFDSRNMQDLITPIYDAVAPAEYKKCIIINQEVGKQILYSVAKQLREDFSNDLHWRLLSLKIDMDFEGPETKFCLSCSFTQEGHITKRILGLIDIVDDSQITEQHIKQVLYKYNIDFNQIIYVCWDNTKAKYNTIATNSNYLTEIENFEKHPLIRLGNLKIERYVGVFAHLCLLDIFKNPDILLPFLNCRNFIKFLSNESNGYYDIFMRNGLCMPQLDSPWRWGSTFKMMQDLQEAYNVLQNGKYPKQELAADQFTVDNDFWLFVNAYCETLNSLQKSITKFYTEEIHFGDFYAFWLNSKLVTEKLMTNEKISNNFIMLISSELLKCFEKRTYDILSNDVFHACLYMDPRFQHILKPENKSKAVIFLKKIWDRCKIYKPQVKDANKETRTEAIQLPEIRDDEESLLTNYLVRAAKEDLYVKIEQLHLIYKPVHTNILLFWENQKLSNPEMCYLSEICFAVPSTQNYKQKHFCHIQTMQTDQIFSTVIEEERAIACLNSHLVHNVSEHFDTVMKNILR